METINEFTSLNLNFDQSAYEQAVEKAKYHPLCGKAPKKKQPISGSNFGSKYKTHACRFKVKTPLKFDVSWKFELKAGEDFVSSTCLGAKCTGNLIVGDSGFFALAASKNEPSDKKNGELDLKFTSVWDEHKQIANDFMSAYIGHEYLVTPHEACFEIEDFYMRISK